ncbi:DUF6932 family protein [Sediminicoccus sp. BL-A-41-H5]|uniref:DUF6932 family protein n=1 Tax=Sediminicoccus sp. BL-A-41-H5 TaxID=3421106 RepID=UPI003D67B5CA
MGKGNTLSTPNGWPGGGTVYASVNECKSCMRSQFCRGERTRVPLPPFDMRGLLPPFIGADAATHDRSPYVSTMSELGASLGTTPERRHLLRNLIAYRALIASDGYTSGFQFIDGSFVENIEALAGRPPGDIDVFSLLDAPTKYLTNSVSWQTHGLPFWQHEIANRNHNKARFSLDTYALLFQELQPMGLIQATIYWYSLFSHQRNTFAWKGFATIPLDPAGDQVALAALGTT